MVVFLIVRARIGFPCPEGARRRFCAARIGAPARCRSYIAWGVPPARIGAPARCRLYIAWGVPPEEGVPPQAGTTHGLLHAIGDASPRQVIRRELHLDLVAGEDA